MSPNTTTLDVREDIRSGREPFSKIMATVAGMSPQQNLVLDPRRDTPEALANFRTLRGLPADTWTLLHGAPDDILELAALLGVKYKEEANGQFAHSNVITVLNAEGEKVHQLVGLGQDITPTVRLLENLLTR